MSESHKVPNPQGAPLTGPVNKSRKKAELQDIAEALGLETSGVVDALQARIRPFLEANTATLSKVPRFAGLYSYKADRKPSKKTVKTSADKAVEDDFEKAKSSALTANRSDLKLKELKVTTDPPGSFAPLSLQKNTSPYVALDEGEKSQSEENKSPVEDIDHNGSSSPLTMTSMDLEAEGQVVPDDNKGKKKADSDKRPDKPRGRPEKPKKDMTAETMPVLMKLISLKDEPTQEVLVPGVRITKFIASDGSTIHQTRLSELLPAVIENNSPMKTRGGNFMRRGIRQGASGPSFMAAGSVEQHIKGGEIRPLLLDFAKNFDLEVTDQGYYTGDIIYDAPAGNVCFISIYLKQILTRFRFRNQKGLQEPRLQARLISPAQDQTSLWTLPASAAKNRPRTGHERHPQKPGAPEGILRIFAWRSQSRPQDLPCRADAEKFLGQEFTKSDIVLALGLKTSTIGNINKYFGHDRLLHTPEAKEWFNSGGVKHGSTYNSMKPSSWKKHLDTNQQAANQRKRRRGNSSSSDSDNSSDEGGNSSDGGQSKRRALKKKKVAKKEKQARKKNSKPDSSDMD
ncbi:hypothetical protein B0H17DRAFT_1137313 [Mycena rosella]|uniref:Uncharacterized protein n=1 Tax=Mycena rosella TaxID=1033263 RepID=A0AAD7DC46_MYCRO|nr:hypothetical protein B0H17DRAFT_1137313 [Mycena rosella]